MATWFDEATKAVVTAIASSLFTQAASLFEAATKPDSPRRALEDGPKTIALVDAWAKASEQLQHIPNSELRNTAQERIDSILRTLTEGQARYDQILDERRTRIFRLLSFLRLARPGGWLQRISSFCFYVALVLLVQAIRLYVSSSWSINPWAIVVLGAITITLWVLSWPKTISHDNDLHREGQ